MDEDIDIIYKGDDVIQALSDVKNKSESIYSTIVIMCTSNLNFNGLKIPCNEFEDSHLYWLLYNQSLVTQNFLDNQNAPLKISPDAVKTARMVENAISTHILRSHNESMAGFEIEHNFSLQDYPKVQSRIFNNFDSSSAQGNFWFIIPVLISFLNLNSEILSEKEKKLRIGLMLFGISSVAYWLSWIIFAFLFDAFYSLFIIGLATLFRFSAFVNTPFWMLWLIFFSVTFAFHCLSMILVNNIIK